ncbi:MAG: 3-hydroxyacyl-CoA dehydrogenase family protein [Thermoplasmata archaeon]|nr:3-hydroxyacyl-CoA dehydrogenase family protein [Thermoplasmata archaeon]
MEIKKVGIIGAGSMGSAIAEVMAYNGLEVILKDQNMELTEKGIKNIKRILDDFEKYLRERPIKEIERIEKLGIKLSDDQKEQLKKNLGKSIDKNSILSRIKPTENFDELKDCDLIIEAIFENQEIKNKLFEDLSKILSEKSILASNTSSLSITEMASHYRIPENVIITHFFNPPYTLPLVEIVPALQTSENTVNTVYEFFNNLKNHRERIVPVKVKERTGFVVNRILIPMINEALKITDEGIADYRTVDIAMKKGAGMPMGPFELADYVGVDIVYHVLRSFREAFGDNYIAPESLKYMISAGWWGMKSGKGFYEYKK